MASHSSSAFAVIDLRMEAVGTKDVLSESIPDHYADGNVIQVLVGDELDAHFRLLPGREHWIPSPALEAGTKNLSAAPFPKLWACLCFCRTTISCSSSSAADFVVMVNGVLGRASTPLPAIQYNRPVTEHFDRVQIMGDEDDRPPFPETP